MKVDEQLQARILTFVLREFLNNKRATPRRDLILAFETEEVSEALGNLTNSSLLRRKDNVCPEQYLPSAASFQFCNDEELKARARTVTTAVLHALRRMFKANPATSRTHSRTCNSKFAHSTPTRRLMSQRSSSASIWPRT